MNLNGEVRSRNEMLESRGEIWRWWRSSEENCVQVEEK